MANFKKPIAIAVYGLIYSFTIWVSWLILKNFPVTVPFLVKLLAVDVTGCLLIFASCVIFNSFSINDLYWTLQVSCLSIYCFVQKYAPISSIQHIPLKSLLVIGLVNMWSIRLSYNLFATGLSHVSHEDWRFVQYRSQWKPKLIYFVFGLFAFIIVPNLMVYAACIPIYFVFEVEKAGEMKLLDWIGCIVTLIGIAFESIGDYQLHQEIARKRKTDPNILSVMDKGLWSLCRHPNYFGEITFWMGVYLTCLNSMIASETDTQFIFLIFVLGPFGIFALIYFGSLPMMEERQLKRRGEAYRSYMRRVTFKLLPFSNVVGGCIRVWRTLKDDQNQKRRKANRKNAPKSK